MKYFFYFKYLLTHKLYVFLYCIKFAFKYDEPILLWRGLIHDWDKLLKPSILVPYANATFGPGRTVNYGLKDGMEDHEVLIKEQDFYKAVIQHKYGNKHHWNYWLSLDSSTQQIREVPRQYILEMMADWFSANKMHKDFPNSKGWYNENRGNILMNQKTRRLVEYLLKKEYK